MPCGRQNGHVEVRRATEPAAWSDAARLLFAYQQETAVEVGAARPTRPEEVWLPVRRETTDPASVHSTFLIAYAGRRPVGGVALVAGDVHSLLLRRCYVLPSERRRGVATALVAEALRLADDRGASRLALDVLASRRGAIAAWRRMGFADAEPWGDPAMAYFERSVGGVTSRHWLGAPYGQVVLCESDRRWADVFSHHAEVIRRSIGEPAAAVEHIGSTAVAGLVAKPIVDIALRLAPEAPAGMMVEALVGAGYEFRGDKGEMGGLFFVAEDRRHRPVAHVHVVMHGDPQWGRYLAVRDRLRADPAARRRYQGVKRELAERFPSDRPAYTAGKALVIATFLTAEVVPWS